MPVIGNNLVKSPNAAAATVNINKCRAFYNNHK